MSSEWIPIILTVLSLVGAAVTYAYQKFVDRRTALVETRRTAYRNFLNAFMAMSDSPERIEEIRRRYYQSEVELLIVGSDDVVQKVGALSRFYAETNENRQSRDAQTVRRLVANICKSMRDDCFEKTNLTVAEIETLVPIV
jgi:hypothetical protein